jgi:hypothetical protein
MAIPVEQIIHRGRAVRASGRILRLAAPPTAWRKLEFSLALAAVVILQHERQSLVVPRALHGTVTPVLDDAARARVMFLAGAALQGAVDQDAPAAAAAINAISAEYGGEGLTEAIIAWCDTLTAALPIPSGGDLAGLGWVDETGQARAADDVDPQVRWAGRIVMARAREDQDTFSALIAALPDDGAAVSQHLAVLLRLIATNLRPVRSGQPPKPDEHGDG